MRKRGRLGRGEDFDEFVLRSIVDGLESIVEKGGSEDVLVEAVEEVSATLLGFAPTIAEDLLKSRARMVRHERARLRRVQRGIKKHWNDALSLFLMLVVLAEEAGRTFDRKHRPPDDEPFDPVFDALLGLHARACQCALEVYVLLSNGLPKGGLARSRTLHELAVTAVVISDHTRESNHPDLATRFLDHQFVTTYKDALNYQENCESLGYEPFSEGEMEDMKARRDEVIELYGKEYKEQYGWAAGLDGPRVPSFRDLERLANLSHLRSYYSWASHEVHSDAKGLLLNLIEWGDTLFRETGYSNEMLGDPGQMALISLNQVTVSLLFSSPDFSPEALLQAKTFGILVNQAIDAFASASDAVDASNRRLQRRQAFKRRVLGGLGRLKRR